MPTSTASSMLALTILCVSFFVSFIHASPLMMRDVFSPTITSPNASTVWPVGTQQTVTWETDNIPPASQLTDPNGMVVLGYLGSNGGYNLDIGENVFYTLLVSHIKACGLIMIDNPLAQDFPLTQGEVDITVPNVTPRDDYIIVLFGDSGNASPAFAITRITNSTTTSTTQSSTSSTISRSANTEIQSSSATSSTSTHISSTTITPSATTTASTSSATGSSSSTSTQTTPASSASSTATAASAAASSNSAWASRHLNAAQLTSVGVASLLLTLLV
ncbi:hypothetical protein H0H92_000337 [Tricholoma furcatifolium]|nr:hypothetical protein H0H92_000337 [Tricholoma furcatifolium]